MKETLEIVNQMQSDGVISRYAIGGAVGATFYLEPAATLDVDIFVLLPPASGTLLSLRPIYEYLTAAGCKAQGEHIVIGGWPVQFLPAANQLQLQALVEAVKTEVEGIVTWVLPAEYLAAIALQTGRPKDHNRILQFLEQRVLDTARFQEILSTHDLAGKWKNFEDRYLNE